MPLKLPYNTNFFVDEKQVWSHCEGCMFMFSLWTTSKEECSVSD